MNRYYPNENGKECGRSSLANLLVELNDPQTAQVVYDNFKRHELVTSNGVVMRFFPKILRDLTEGKYSGLVYGRLKDNWEQPIKRLYSDTQEKVVRVAYEELALKTITEIENYKGNFPVIASIEVYPKQHHAIVMKNSYIIIDDGLEIIKPYHKLKIITIFEAKKLKKF